MTSKKLNIAPAASGGSEWRKIRARMLGEKHTPTVDEIRHELEDKAREENEVFNSLRGD